MRPSQPGADDHWAVGVDAIANQIYVPVIDDGELVVVDGATNATTLVRTGPTPIAVAVNPVTHKIYVANRGSNYVTVVAGKGPQTTAALSSSLNPSIYGQSVTWTAKVTTLGPAAPTGRVKFTWGIYSIGSATLDGSEVATLTNSNINADAYPLTAVYVGDVMNQGSTSAILSQGVTQTTSAATIASLLNPSMQGQAAKFTAKITSPTVTPRGPVTFKAGTTVLGTVELSGGRATLTTSSLPAGSAKVTVTYYGDSNITKSSASVTQTVR